MFHIVFKPHRNHLLAQTTAPQKLFALLKVLPGAQLAQRRPPVAWVFVIDGSGSMREKFANSTKMDVAIAAVRRLLQDERVHPDDLVSLIEFDDNAHVLLPLSPLDNGDAAEAALRNLSCYQGGTQMGTGFEATLKELSRLRPGVHVARRVLVLTDGETSDEPRCREIAGQFAASNTALITLGVGDKYNENLLSDLSEATQGRPYHLGDAEELGRVLNVEVESSTREVVGEVQLNVQTVRGVQLNSVTRVYPHLAEVTCIGSATSDGALPFGLGNIVAGDYGVWTLEFTIAGMARPAGRARLAQLGLSGRAAGDSQIVEATPQELNVSFAPDESATTQVDHEVLGYVQQRNADRLMREASQLAPHDAQAAGRKLQSAVSMTRQVGNAPLTKMLEGAIDELSRTGTLSSARRKTVMLSGRTRTISLQAPRSGQNGDLTKVDFAGPDEAEIRRLTEGGA